MHKCRTVTGDETENLLAHCNHYDVEVLPGQNIGAHLFDKNLGLNALPRNELHMVMLATVDDMLSLCFASTAMTVPVFVTACTEKLGGRKGDEEETKCSLAHCKQYHKVDVWGKQLKLNILSKSSAQNLRF